jgi:hypothetical protein
VQETISKFLGYAIAGLMLLGFAGQANAKTVPTTKNAPAERIFDKDKTFSLSIPRTWEVKKDVMGASVVGISPQETAKDTFRENVNVVLENLTEQLVPKSYYDANQAVLKKLFTDFKKKSEGVTKIDNRDFYWSVFTHRMGTVQAEVYQFMSVKDKRGYVITCSSTPAKFDKYKGQFEEIAKTFRFESTTPAGQIATSPRKDPSGQ